MGDPVRAQADSFNFPPKAAVTMANRFITRANPAHNFAPNWQASDAKRQSPP